MQPIFDKVDDEIERRLVNGDTVPGYAMQPGNSSNQWNSPEEDIAKMLKSRRLKKEQIYPAKLISCAQVLKLKELTPEQKARENIDK